MRLRFSEFISTETILGLTLLASVLSAQLIPVQAQTDQRSLRVKRSEQVKQWPNRAKRWALIIGVDQYKDKQISSLNGAANDAKLLADALIQYAGFPPDQVVLLATDQPEERQPTRINILRRLSNLKAAVPQDGLLVISFAGHGIEQNTQAYLLPSDAQISDDIAFLEETSLSVSRMRDRIRAMGVQQVVLILDACRSDPMGRADMPNRLTEAYTRSLNFDLINKDVTAFAILYATAVGERAYEYAEKRQGYFTWAVVEGLKGAAANDRGEVTLAGLLKYIQEIVPKRIIVDLGRSKRQRPFAVIEGYKADELVLAVVKTLPSDSPDTTSRKSVDVALFELSFWDTIKFSKDRADFEAYLNEFPNGRFVSLAENRLKNLEEVVKNPSPTNADLIKLLRDRKYDEAIPLAESTLSDQTKNLGPEHPLVARTLNNLALAYYQKGDYEKAESFYQRSLAILVKAFGIEHPEVTTILINLGDLYRAKKDYQKAEPLYLRALAIREKVFGPDDPYVGQSINNLGELYYEQAKYSKAEILYRRAVTLDARNDSYHHKLGLSLFRQQKYDEAEAEFKEAIKLKPNNITYQDALKELSNKK
jgi:tetratricopeptide (TPR) repeat protein